MDNFNKSSAISLNSTIASSSIGENDSESNKQLICGLKDEFPLGEIFLPDIDSDASQRSVLITRRSFNDSFGFALQSYIFKRSPSDIYERITYVDYVSALSPAAKVGIKKGDIVIAVNGCCVISSSHAEIVESIMNCLHVTLVLVFKDVARIVSLSMRSIQLKLLLESKLQELIRLEEQEKELEKNENAIKSTLAQLNDEFKNIEASNMDYRHLIRINSNGDVRSPQITRL